MADRITSGATAHRHIVRALALIDLAKALPSGSTLPEPGEATDRDDKLEALLAAMQSELEAAHAEVVTATEASHA